MALRTPTQIESHLSEVQHTMDCPQQWYGTEPNSYRRDWDDATLRWLLFACWPYEQAAGNQAIPLVYRVINEASERYLADRCYFPASPRDFSLFERAGIPLHGIESKHQMRDFDVVGTSISYPVLTINFVKQLEASDIPCTWEDRWSFGEQRWIDGRAKSPEDYPMVIVGGQAYGVPEVLSPIADAIFCGEVEDEPGKPGLVAVCRRIEQCKELGWWDTDRERCYRRLAREFDFLYFPRFVETDYEYQDRPGVERAARDRYEYRKVLAEYHDKEIEPFDFELAESKQVRGLRGTLPGMRLPIVKRFVSDLDAVEGLDNPPLLYTDPGMGTGDLEVARGCPAWCSFCRLTYSQKPFRQRSVDFSVNQAKRLMANTGGMHIAPFAPDFPQHTEKKQLLTRLLNEVTGDVDASSMRVDDFIADPDYSLIQAEGGMHTVTLGVEGNSQRMRDMVGKGSSDEEIRTAVAKAIKAGISKIKLYMIAALPGETPTDTQAIVNLAKDLVEIRESMGSNAQLILSWSPLLVEGNTPLQWFAPTYSTQGLGGIWDQLQDHDVTIKMGSKVQWDRMTYFQLCQRASADVGKVLIWSVADTDKGSWGGVTRGFASVLDANLREWGFRNGVLDCYDERFEDDLFGWEHIDQAINPRLLWNTYRRMKEFVELTDPETYDDDVDDDFHGNEWIARCDEQCQGKSCGACSPADLKIRSNYIRAADGDREVTLDDVDPIDLTTEARKIRLRVVKALDRRLVMNDHWGYAIRRAAYRAGVPVVPASITLTSDRLKSRDWSSGVDYVEFAVTRVPEPGEVDEWVRAIDDEFGRDMSVTGHEVRGSEDDVRDDFGSALYELEVAERKVEMDAMLDKFRQQDHVDLTIKDDTRYMGAGRSVVNAHDHVLGAWTRVDGRRLLLCLWLQGAANPYEVYLSVTGKRSWLQAARHPAVCVEQFHAQQESDWLSPSCESCGQAMMTTLGGEPFDRCLR